MRAIKAILISLILMFPLVLSLPAYAATQVLNPDNLCGQSGASSSPACQARTTSLNPVTSKIHEVIVIIGIVAGLAAVISIIIGGLMYIFSNGEQSKVNNAKDTILYSVIGLIVIVAAQTIILFVTDRI